MWKLEVEDLGREQGFDLEAFLTDDPDWGPGEPEVFGVVVQASRAGIILGIASIWDVQYDEDGDTLYNALGTYGTDLIEEAIADARCSLQGIRCDTEDDDV